MLKWLLVVSGGELLRDVRAAANLTSPKNASSEFWQNFALSSSALK